MIFLSLTIAPTAVGGAEKGEVDAAGLLLRQGDEPGQRLHAGVLYVAGTLPGANVNASPFMQ